ncbi:hypothetical protein SUGI_0746980 [Cryptomeria japonica]|uniref:probable trehalose-phosphate phosphatase C n=1 Tax=Cryptomeria japonica TaxID=3369 RepID=UPI0024149137|nr:probable trehalose-phosphate phosphatase C [Cryptomeria japonica]XP_057864524.1 probable trehalose-phosphate phosphatase C [Cryptomeria japonica]GLJ36938.1 hypothetical protein SUGI_0746980 [Cryptomeria japonica]
MAFKHTVMLGDSPSIGKPRSSLSSLPPLLRSSSLVSYSTSSPSHSPTSTTLPQRKMFPSSIGTDNWIDCMKTRSSCDDIKLANEFKLDGVSPDMPNESYASWMRDHPSALKIFEQMMSASKNKQIAVFLDYDGTLSPIVDDPERAFMSVEMRSTVKELAKYCPTAIISGRSRDKVFDFVQLAELYYAGSHGMDIMLPARAFNGTKNGYTRNRDQKGNEVVLFQPAREFLPMIDEVYKLLQEKVKIITGATVENNRFCVSVHFRCVQEKDWSALTEIVRNLLQTYPRLHLTQGKRVLEIRPLIKWHKGNALEFLLESLGLASSSDVIPLYIGDDCTDEDAFNVLKARGRGFSILVSSVPKKTNASYSLRNPSEVMEFLRHLVTWKQQSSNSRSKA